MTFAARGAGTSAAEVTNISKHGFWLMIGDREAFLPFESFPWFKDAPVGRILNVELPSPDHLYWPELDVDLEAECIFHPDEYPLVSRVHEKQEQYAALEREDSVDRDRIDDCVLALLQLTLHLGSRAWKGLDYEVMDRLHAKGYILDPRNRTKSIVLTEEGSARSKALFMELFAKAK
jgi:hypothetical protein